METIHTDSTRVVERFRNSVYVPYTQLQLMAIELMLPLKILCIAEFCTRPHYCSTTNDKHLIKTKTTWLTKSAVLEFGLFIQSVTSDKIVCKNHGQTR